MLKTIEGNLQQSDSHFHSKFSLYFQSEDSNNESHHNKKMFDVVLPDTDESDEESDEKKPEDYEDSELWKMRLQNVKELQLKMQEIKLPISSQDLSYLVPIRS